MSDQINPSSPDVSPRHRVLIVGATSAIATEVARLFAREGSSLFLMGRSREKLDTQTGDLAVRGATRVESATLDFTEIERQQAAIKAAFEAFDGFDMVLVAYGTLGDQQASEQSVELALRELTTNATSVIAALTVIGNLLERQGSGTLAVLSSVAGDRGRPSNYVYGSAKAAVSTFLQGLRARLSQAGVQVLTVKPGMVDTPMTAHMKKGPLFASPERVGRDIYHAMLKGRDVVYTPFYWRYVMLVIRLIPEPVFKRLKL